MNLGSYYLNDTYSIVGTYDYFIWANDTSGNVAVSAVNSFTIIPTPDTELPEITSVDAQPDPQLAGGFVNITCDVSDDTAVDEVWVNITDPLGGMTNDTMIFGSYYYNQTYIITGEYLYFIWANDTSGNSNMSVGHSFTVNPIPDTEFPEISGVDAQPDPQLAGGFVNITCVVTDNEGVDEVWVNISDPNSDIINVSMNEGSYYYEMGK